MKKIREKREKESLESDYSSLLGKSINQLLFEYLIFFTIYFFQFQSEISELNPAELTQAPVSAAGINGRFQVAPASE